VSRKTKRKADVTRNGFVAHATRQEQAPEDTKGGLKWRLASEVTRRNVEWLIHPWLPRGMLTLIVGHPGVGKSTFLASIVAWETTGRFPGQANQGKPGRVVLLPGHEEQFDVMTAPRLHRAGVDLDRVKFLDGGNLSLVRDRDRLTGIVDSFGATLVVGDPIDSYVDDGFSEDRGQDVRPLLEAAAGVGTDTGATVVFARHPGKDPNNILPGSRQWRAVPRVVVQLTSDGHVPPRYLISHFKDSLGTEAGPRRYSLLDDGTGPRLFTFEEEVERSAEELAKAAGGPTGRYKLMAACQLIRWLFAEETAPTRSALGSKGREQGLGEDTINDALRLLGVKSVPGQGRDSPWKLVRTQDEWPAWLPTPTPP